jgi:hypothetical protein
MLKNKDISFNDNHISLLKEYFKYTIMLIFLKFLQNNKKY